MVTRTDKNSYKWWQGGWRLQQWWGQGHYNSRLLTETWLPCQYAKQTCGSKDSKKSSHVPHHLLHLKKGLICLVRFLFRKKHSHNEVQAKTRNPKTGKIQQHAHFVHDTYFLTPPPSPPPFLSQLACFCGRTSDRCLIYHSCQPIYLKIECILPSVFNIMFSQGRYFWELLISRVVERKSFTGQPLPVYPSNSG